MGERNTLFLSCSYTKNSQIPYESFLMKVLAVIFVQWIVVRMDAEILGERCSTSTVQCNQNSMQCYVAFLLLFIFFPYLELSWLLQYYADLYGFLCAFVVGQKIFLLLFETWTTTFTINQRKWLFVRWHRPLT